MRVVRSGNPVVAVWLGALAVGALAGCGSVSDKNSPDAGTPVGTDAPTGGSSDGGPAQVCTPNQALRCDGQSLVSCNADGSAEATTSCSLGCNATSVRCLDVAPSNGLAQYLDMTAAQPDLNLGTSATINSDDGTVQVDGKPVVVASATVTQTPAPTLRVFIVKSLTAMAVTVTGAAPLAIVSNGDIQIAGTFAASAASNVGGAGAFNDGNCVGGAAGAAVTGGAVGGAGGGGFGTAGAPGGAATNINGTSAGGAAGLPTGNVTLVPLRGGCAGGLTGGSLFGAGGGAIQLVSRTKISISGVVAANGASFGAGGSGGGILLEAPALSITGNVVANGGAGSAGSLLPSAAENGRLDNIPATGGAASDPTETANGGNGAAGTTGARSGSPINVANGNGRIGFAGYGGGGVGRIRVNAPPGGLVATGIFSPNPSTGTLATR
jgi:hypothetical protein